LNLAAVIGFVFGAVPDDFDARFAGGAADAGVDGGEEEIADGFGYYPNCPGFIAATCGQQRQRGQPFSPVEHGQ